MFCRLKFAYDPWGNPTTTGSASQYPFLFKGMDYDATDFYYGGGVYRTRTAGGQFSRLVRQAMAAEEEV
jgi:hypothetical protein